MFALIVVLSLFLLFRLSYQTHQINVAWKLASRWHAWGEIGNLVLEELGKVSSMRGGVNVDRMVEIGLPSINGIVKEDALTIQNPLSLQCFRCHLTSSV